MDEHLALGNRVKELRTVSALSQNELARMADVSRQTIGGIETGQYSPSATVAMRIARALGSRVEDVFWLREEASVEATAIGTQAGDRQTRVSLSKIGDRWIAHSLVATGETLQTIVPADGLVTRQDGNAAIVRVLEDAEALSNSVTVAGCAPAIELWARTIERGQSSLRPHVVSSNSTSSLNMLRRGEVHLAGIHFADSSDGRATSNRAAAAAALSGHSGGMVNMGGWCEGLIVAKGNPKRLLSIADIAQPGTRFVNRESGAGSRKLFDARLAGVGITSSAIAGYSFEVGSPTAIASAIACNQADIGMGVESIALIYGLDFIPLEMVRYEVVYMDQFLQPSVRRFLDTLTTNSIKAQFSSIGCSDTQALGEVTAFA